MNRKWMTLSGIVLSVLASFSAQAAEFELQRSSTTVRDSDYNYFSGTNSLPALDLRVYLPQQSLLPDRPWLDYFVTASLSMRPLYGQGSAGQETYDEDMYCTDCASTFSAVSGGLNLFGAQAGVRLQRQRSSHFQPYATVALKAQRGRFVLSDQLSSWVQTDPEDPTGRTILFLNHAGIAKGTTVGVQATAGITYLVEATPARHAKKKATPEPVVSAPDAALPVPPTASTQGPATASTVAPPAPQAAPKAAPPAAAPAAPQAGSQASAPAAAPAAPQAAPTPLEASQPETQKRKYWGLNLELGYNGQTELKLDEAGTLDLSGFIVQGGFRYIF